MKLADTTPIKEQPIPYPADVEKWLDGELDTMLETDRIEQVDPDEDVPMTTALVLVPNA